MGTLAHGLIRVLLEDIQVMVRPRTGLIALADAESEVVGRVSVGGDAFLETDRTMPAWHVRGNLRLDHIGDSLGERV